MALEVLAVQAELLALADQVALEAAAALADQVALEAAAALALVVAVAVAVDITMEKAVFQLSAVVAAAVLVLQEGQGEVQGITMAAMVGPPEALVTPALAVAVAVDTAE